MRDVPSLCSPEQQSALLDAISRGNYHEPACAFVGVSYNAFRAWMARGEADHDGPYRTFYDDVRRAESTGELQVVGLFRDAAEKDWRAAASFAGRRYPQRWSEQGPRREPGDGGVTINVGITLQEATKGGTIEAPVTWTELPKLPPGDN